MDLETLAWLRTDDGARLLAQAGEAFATADGDPVAAATAVRRLEPDPARASAALTQVQLRVKGVAKFGEDALRMFFTGDGLEQSTRRRVADHRAARISATGGMTAIDLGCGIGGDLLAMARVGLTAAGVDLDPLRVAIAQANLEALSLPGAVTVAEATEVDTAGFDVVFLDPARRGARGRVFDVNGWTPPWDFVTGTLQGRNAGAPRAVVKVAPGIGHDLIPSGVEAEWVSELGDVKEAVLWSAPLATVARRATVLAATGLATLTDEDDPYQGQPRPLSELGPFLYEPDGAVIRAGLVTAVAAGVNGGLLDANIAYVTADESFHTPFARSYRVLEQLPYREKQLKLALQQRNIGRLTIKKRGVDIVPEELRKRLKLRGDNEATLVLTRINNAGAALLVAPF